jgi:REP element-mobilizing transposase RayT
MRINYVNADHVHALIDMPTSYSIEEVMKLLKGSSSHWINDRKLLDRNIFWGRGYGAFSVSESNIPKVIAYIEGQEEHHKAKTFTAEYEDFIKAYGLHYIITQQ